VCRLLRADGVASFVIGVHLGEAVFEVDHSGFYVGKELDDGVAAYAG